MSLAKKIDEMLTWDIDGHKEPAIFAPEMKKAITKLVTAEIIAELERNKHLVNQNLGTKRAYQDRIDHYKAKETQL